MPKFIFVTGGVLSSLGKGIAAASIGALLEASGLKVTIQKLDPYINVDPGTLSPFQHGEVFVTDDGAETDLDLEKLFLPAWAQETPTVNRYAKYTGDEGVPRGERSGDESRKGIQ